MLIQMPDYFTKVKLWPKQPLTKKAHEKSWTFVVPPGIEPGTHGFSDKIPLKPLN